MGPVPPEPTTNPAIAAYGPRRTVVAAPFAGLLAWLVPGLGHIYLGYHLRGLICMVTITLTFWTGVAIGSVQATVDPHERGLWFMAQLGTGGNALTAYVLHRAVESPEPLGARPVFTAHWLSADVGVHYTGVAGLLNLLVILDALGRAEASPVRRRRRDHPPGIP